MFKREICLGFELGIFFCGREGLFYWGFCVGFGRGFFVCLWLGLFCGFLVSFFFIFLKNIKNIKFSGQLSTYLVEAVIMIAYTNYTVPHSTPLVNGIWKSVIRVYCNFPILICSLVLFTGTFSATDLKKS